jgi:hypothetical protein
VIDKEQSDRPVTYKKSFEGKSWLTASHHRNVKTGLAAQSVMQATDMLEFRMVLMVIGSQTSAQT